MSVPARPTDSSATSELDQLPDRDAEETEEWRASLDAVMRHAGPERAVYLLRRVHEYAAASGVTLPGLLSSDYINTIPASSQPVFPGDIGMESRITALNRWNAAAMVTRGSRLGLGGHISTYASAAWLYEIGFNHFFRGKDQDGSGDQLFLQGHASPGIYARVFLEGRLHEDRLDGFRREAGGHGLPSYPHPRRLPWLWEFPTVSMGLGPLAAVYQARFNRYLHSRGIKDTSGSHVWASSVTARRTSPSRRPRSNSRHARASTTSPSSSTATSSGWTVPSGRTPRSCRSSRPGSGVRAGMW